MLANSSAAVIIRTLSGMTRRSHLKLLCSSFRSPTAFHRAFASTSSSTSSNISDEEDYLSPSAERLAEMFGREEVKERSDMQLPKEVQDLKKTIEDNWELDYNGAVTTLTSTASLPYSDQDLKVKVTFHCMESQGGRIGDKKNLSVDALADRAICEQEGIQRPDAIHDNMRYLDSLFTIQIAAAKSSRYNNNSGTTNNTLTFDCQSEDGKCVILDATSSKAHATANYRLLPQSLKDEMHAMIEHDLGINDSVIDFVTVYNSYREKKHYVHFLRECRELLTA